jgi:hypothetical protein
MADPVRYCMRQLCNVTAGRFIDSVEMSDCSIGTSDVDTIQKQHAMIRQKADNDNRFTNDINSN